MDTHDEEASAKQKLYGVMAKLSGSSRLFREELDDAQKSLEFWQNKLESHKVLASTSKATPRLYAMISGCAGSVQREADKLADPRLLSFKQIRDAELDVLLWFKYLKEHMDTLGEKPTLEAKSESNPNLGANKDVQAPMLPKVLEFKDTTEEKSYYNKIAACAGAIQAAAGIVTQRSDHTQDEVEKAKQNMEFWLGLLDKNLKSMQDES